jgi:magnesium chelatase family protein
MASLVVGGQKAWPGEVSLAHRGVLFLDELAEFSRPALDSLRQPLETGDIVIARANHHVRYPARFQLVAAMNPCRCGYLSDPARACSRAPRCAQDYISRISGLILDRFDILLRAAELRRSELLSDQFSESTADVRMRILSSRKFAATRQADQPEILNAHLEAKSLNEELKNNEEIRTLYSQALEKQTLSARGYHKSIRVARTIADLAASQRITRYHVLEALFYRRLFLFGADNG